MIEEIERMNELANKLASEQQEDQNTPNEAESIEFKNKIRNESPVQTIFVNNETDMNFHENTDRKPSIYTTYINSKLKTLQ